MSNIFLPNRFVFFQQASEDQEPQISQTTSNQSNKDVNTLRRELEIKVRASKIRSEEDKKLMLEWLQTSPKSHDAKELKIQLEAFNTVERTISDLIQQYTKKVQTAAKEGRANKSHEKEHINWFKELSFAEKMKYLKTCALDDPKRAEVAKIFKKLPGEFQKGLKSHYENAHFDDRLKLVEEAKELHDKYRRLPAAVRKSITSKIRAAGDIKTLRAIIETNLEPHERLKKRFLALDKKTQAQHREPFKGMRIEEREQFLRSVEGEQAAAEKLQEHTREGREESFRKKMMGKIHEGLFSHRSFMAYDVWFRNLSDEEQKKMLKNSDLDDPQRLKLYNEFYALPEKVRTPEREQKFLNADLEGRQALIAEISGEKSPMGVINYPERTVQHALDKALANPGLQRKRMIYTLIHKVQVYSRRAEIADDKSATQMSEQRDPENQNNEKRDDSFRWVSTGSLLDKQDKREKWREALIDLESVQGKDQAKIRGTAMYNWSSQVVGAEAFEQQVVAHVRGELVAGVARLASEDLPGMDPAKLRQYAEKLNFDVDLRRTIAN
ncbi:hypothetical protein COV82_05165 [Candidatus Peregrinibacteria bacterium CG11_big_fil_rev_8_21_14_0_20_46_8]|nr:MAG: hypothetical protein COV82_05165 [Candidatus Peregrinibacteria bacterium CG11_big_fil_rev_8_21_14_0_20_46_8]